MSISKIIMCFVAISMSLTSVYVNAATTGVLEKEFSSPPQSARPRVYWYWMNGNLSKDGATRDLEAMKEIGLGGAMIMEVACVIPEGDVRTRTPQWWDMIRHVLKEADRLGLEIAFGNGTGWSGSQGPWVKPENAMQHVVSSETPVKGPMKFEGELPQPYQRYDFYRDIAVFAIPAVRGDMEAVGKPKITTSQTGIKIRVKDLNDVRQSNMPRLPDSLEVMNDGDPETVLRISRPKNKEPISVTLEYPALFTARNLHLSLGYWQSIQGGSEIQVSEDGQTWHNIRDFSIHSGGVTRRSLSTCAFEPVTSRWFRIVFGPNINSPINGCLSIGEISIGGGTRIENWEAASGFTEGHSRHHSAALDAADVVETGSMIKLSSRMNRNGKLKWDVPAGDWMIIRMGHTTFNTPYNTPPKWAQGLETDKFSRKALTAHWDEYMAKIIKKAGPLAGKTLWATHTDSWECGSQNWTPGFIEEFRKRRGYDMTPYLPTFTGRVVGSAEETQRFFWDLKRTQADLVADNYFGGLADLAHKNGLRFTTEAYGGGPFDAYECAGRSDIPMNEIWTREWKRKPEDNWYVKWASSPAHIYGRKRVGCEAFSTSPDLKNDIGGWLDHPYSVKVIGDNHIFCGGVNLLSIHVYGFQPWKDAAPGMTVGHWGFDFNRGQTWWNYAGPWVDYLSRSSYLLQQGLFVADALYFNGETPMNHAPDTRSGLRPALPKGYDYDSCPAEVLMERAQVKNGRIVLPDGMSYTYLVVNHGEPMSLPMVEKIRDLVQAGATVVGPKPQPQSPGLSGYPECEMKIAGILDQVWGDCDGNAIKEHSFGKGRVVWDKSFAEIMFRDRLGPDFSYEAGTNLVNYIHRRTDEEDIYFVANYQYEPVEATLSFRVSGKMPEFWHPDTGRIEPVNQWRQENGRTVIPYRFDPAGSVFVIFRDTSSKHNKNAKDQKNWTEFTPLQELKEPWEVQFDPKWFYPDNGCDGKVVFTELSDWAEMSDPAIKYFSGTAVYRTTFQFTGTQKPETPVVLDLGRVAIMAEVKLNGHDLGVLWKPPFRVDVTQAIKQGRNKLEIKVVNQWANRLIGDEQFPDDVQWQGANIKRMPDWAQKGRPSDSSRRTFTTRKHWTKDAPLRESGLLGPVTIQTTISRPTFK